MSGLSEASKKDIGKLLEKFYDEVRPLTPHQKVEAYGELEAEFIKAVAAAKSYWSDVEHSQNVEATLDITYNKSEMYEIHRK